MRDMESQFIRLFFSVLLASRSMSMCFNSASRLLLWYCLPFPLWYTSLTRTCLAFIPFIFGAVLVNVCFLFAFHSSHSASRSAFLFLTSVASFFALTVATLAFSRLSALSYPISSCSRSFFLSILAFSLSKPWFASRSAASISFSLIFCKMSRASSCVLAVLGFALSSSNQAGPCFITSLNELPSSSSNCVCLAVAAKSLSCSICWRYSALTNSMSIEETVWANSSGVAY
mmetsp:Transcript_29195/g.81668  ORF Transcript_29195/g.81668 Transcript_29195/m.81668 type:complete len:230 (-) Transcript_29195:98-787(-)